jgi:hypothetical protein
LSTIRSRPAYDPEAIRRYAIARYGYAIVGPQLRDFYLRTLGKS